MSLEPDIIQKWIDKKKDEGYAQSILKNILTCLSGALIYAVQPFQYIKANSCIYVKTPKVPISEERKAHTEYICVIRGPAGHHPSGTPRIRATLHPGVFQVLRPGVP